MHFSDALETWYKQNAFGGSSASASGRFVVILSVFVSVRVGIKFF